MRAQLLIAAPVKRSSFTVARPSSLTKSQLPAPLQLLDRSPPGRVISTCVKANAFTFFTFSTNFPHIFHRNFVKKLNFCGNFVENSAADSPSIYTKNPHIGGEILYILPGPKIHESTVKANPFTPKTVTICNIDLSAGICYNYIVRGREEPLHVEHCSTARRLTRAEQCAIIYL